MRGGRVAGIALQAALFVSSWGATLAASPSLRADTVSPPLSHDTPSENACGKGWVFFDLGNTIVNTTDWDHMRYMPGGREYVRAVQAAGFHLGLISNVPDTWGSTLEAKLAHMKNEIAQGWAEAEAFEWQAFETILLPPTDADRKPAPYLFLQARGLHPRCRIAFEGKDPAEVQAARNAGFEHAYAVGKTVPGEFYEPIEKIFQTP